MDAISRADPEVVPLPPESRAFLVRMGELSHTLAQLCRDHGITHHGAIQRTVDVTAKKHGLRRWCDTRDEADYHRLISATRGELTGKALAA